MNDLISRKYLYDKMLEKEELARQRVLDTPTHSPAYLRYVAQLNERTALKHEIADAPDVTDTNVGSKWIPCSERLPDTSTQVLVTLGYTYESDYTMYSIARYIHFENGECHWCDNYYGYLEWDKFSDGKGGDSSRRVLAWMPLPEPYKGE